MTQFLSVDSAESASARGCFFSSNMYDGTNLRCVCVGGGRCPVYLPFLFTIHCTTTTGLQEAGQVAEAGICVGAAEEWEAR